MSAWGVGGGNIDWESNGVVGGAGRGVWVAVVREAEREVRRWACGVSGGGEVVCREARRV